MDITTLGAAVAMAKKVMPQVTSADAGKLATVDSNGKWAAADLEVGQGEVAVDSTLLVSGAAADAKATGDKVNELKSAISQVDSDVATKAEKTIHFYDFPWTKGYIGSDGATVSHIYYFNTDYIRTDAGDSIEYQGLRSPSISYPIIAYYDKSKTYMSTASVTGDGTESQSGTATVPSGAAYVRFVIYYFYEQGTKLDHITMPMYTVKADTNADDIKKLSDPVALMQYTVDGFEQFSFSTTGKTIKIQDGTELSYQYMDCTDYISTDGIFSITAKIKSLNKYNTAIACYDADKNYIKTASLYPNNDGASSASWQDVEGTVTINDTIIKYIRIAIANNANHDNDTISVLRERTLKADYLDTKGRVSNIEAELNPWKGKKWYAFGTSLTDSTYLDPNNDPTGKYPALLNKYMQAILINKGKGGGGITSHSNGSVLTAIQNTNFSDADLVTLEGFPNDYSAAPGEFTDTTTDTLCGALYVALSTIYQKAPNATVVLITASQGKLNAAETSGYPINFVSATGNYQVEYNDAIIKMGQYFGCYVIDAGGKAQINNYHPDYLVDHIHHSWAGGWQYAATIWEELKHIHPNTSNPYLT